MFKKSDLIKLSKKYDRKLASKLVTAETDKRMSKQNNNDSRRETRKKVLKDLKLAISLVAPETHYSYRKSKSEIYIQAYKWFKQGMFSTKGEAIKQSYISARLEAFECDVHDYICISDYVIDDIPIYQKRNGHELLSQLLVNNFLYPLAFYKRNKRYVA